MTAGTVLSILCLGALGALLPWGISRFLPDTLRGIAVSLACSVVLLTLIGAALFAWLYARDIGTEALLSTEALVHFWFLGVRGALIWLPVMVLTGLGLAQGVERRKGEREMRR